MDQNDKPLNPYMLALCLVLQWLGATLVVYGGIGVFAWVGLSTGDWLAALACMLGTMLAGALMYIEARS